MFESQTSNIKHQASNELLRRTGFATPSGNGEVIFMGEIRTTVKLRNIKEGDSIVEDALVDSGSTFMVIPESVKERLLLDEIEDVRVEVANGNSENVKIAGYAEVEILGRKSVFDCVVMGNEILVGQIVLERLDLLLDPRRQQLIPRYPEIVSAKAKRLRN